MVLEKIVNGVCRFQFEEVGDSSKSVKRECTELSRGTLQCREE